MESPGLPSYRVKGNCKYNDRKYKELHLGMSYIGRVDKEIGLYGYNYMYKGE